METVNLILSLIANKGITEQKFLSDLGYNRTLLSDWKSGKSKSYKKNISEIATYFNVSTDYLLGKTENPTTTNDSEVSEPTDPVFFRLKKGLETYNIDEDDIDFLLTVMKAHKERNK